MIQVMPANELRIHAARSGKNRRGVDQKVRPHKVDRLTNKPPHNPCWTEPVNSIWNLRPSYLYKSRVLAQVELGLNTDQNQRREIYNQKLTKPRCHPAEKCE